MKLALYFGLFLLGITFAWLVYILTDVIGLCLIYGGFFTYLGYEIIKSPIQEEHEEIEK